MILVLIFCCLSGCLEINQSSCSYMVFRHFASLVCIVDGKMYLYICDGILIHVKGLKRHGRGRSHHICGLGSRLFKSWWLVAGKVAFEAELRDDMFPSISS